MAKRPVFLVLDRLPYVDERETEFTFHPGFSIQQKQHSIASLHDSFHLLEPDHAVLEVSSKSPDSLGVELSAFNLMIHHPGYCDYSVESAFQASKVFLRAGPFADLFEVSSRESKSDPRLKDSGQLIGFRFFSRDFPLEPKTYFYDWLYASALIRKPDLLSAAVKYDAFTDIEFNPNKSINCQARSVAKAVGLWRKNLLAQALSSPEIFLEIGYGQKDSDNVVPRKPEGVQAQDFLF